MSPNRPIVSGKSNLSSPITSTRPLTIRSWPEALNAWVSRRASRMPTIWNAFSLVIAFTRVWLYSELSEQDPRTVGRKGEQGPDDVSQNGERDCGGLVERSVQPSGSDSVQVFRNPSAIDTVSRW